MSVTRYDTDDINFPPPVFYNEIYRISWQLRKFNALAVYHFSIMSNRYKFSLISLNKCNLIAPDMAQGLSNLMRRWISEAGKFYAIKRIGRRQFPKCMNFIVRFKSLMNRLVHRRLWFQVRWKENQSQDEIQIYPFNTRAMIYSCTFYAPRFSSRVDLIEQQSGLDMNLCNTKQSISPVCANP